MCGIVGLHLRDESLHPQLGALLGGMLAQVEERGPDSAGIGLYGDTTAVGDAVYRHGDLSVYKGVGLPTVIGESVGLSTRTGHQGLAHTRMATESAVTLEGSHPFTPGGDLCLVHNGSFANYASVRRDLEKQGHVFETANDSEVAARFVRGCLDKGDDLHKALLKVCEVFDGFYTLLVTTSTEFAVVRDRIGCKPLLVAETDAYVAVASEYRALYDLPGIKDARVFEPACEEVFLWKK